MEARKQEAYQMDSLSMADGGMYAGHDETMQPQSDGTTILSIKYNGGILLGADSRSSNVSLQIIKDSSALIKFLQEFVFVNHLFTYCRICTSETVFLTNLSQSIIESTVKDLVPPLTHS